MAAPFSPETREAALAALPSADLDLLVIGGGITGAAVARDAALRGLAVALVERIDWAAGTSSRSSKLIHAAGALCANHAEVTAVEGCEVTLQDAFGGPVRRVRSRAVVNAAGPWVDVVRARARALSGARLHLTKGIHLVVRRDRLPVQHIVVMQARDRRSVFAVPHGDFTYLGTTDTDYGAPIAYPEVTSEDAAYLFEAAERTFAAPAPTSADVVATWAGLRPLLHEEGKGPSEISRRDEIMEAENGLVSIAGGKLTTHRRMAERVVDLVVERLGRVAGACRTASVPLPNGGLAPEELPRLVERVRARLPQLGRSGAERLVALHGAGIERILARALASPAAGE